jgi:amidohydrolase
MIDILKIRKQLHEQPEISGEEARTSRFISNHLEKIGGIRILNNLPHHSLIGVIEGKNPVETVLLRCELDALPIEEINDFNYRSKIQGVSHACGHDGHMAIMLGVAKNLIANPPKKGRVLLLFQSAEETGQGARAIRNSGVLDTFNIDWAFALHNLPGYDSGAIVCKPGNFTPAVESITIKLTGKTSHAGEPEKGINPAQTVARIIDYLNQSCEPDRKSSEYFLVTPIQIQMGEDAFGTSAGEAIIKYTFRAWDKQVFVRKKKEMEQKMEEICRQEPGLKLQYSWTEPFEPNLNHPEAYQIVKQAAKENNYTFIEKNDPLTWGEDFGLFTEVYNGTMFGIGSGENHPALHNPDYDFPDVILGTGIHMFVSIVHHIFNRH